jgi:oleate hydratase
MPGKSITIIESSGNVGGALDGERLDRGYRCRGERELEPRMECLWYLCSQVPSLENPGRTVLDDVVLFNKDEPQHSEARAFHRNGRRVYMHDTKLSKDEKAQLMRLLLSPESEFEDMRIDEYFKQGFFESNFWLDFHTKLAFKPIHSLMEMRRYLLRFMAQSRPEYNDGILHTKYNEYDAIVKPLKVWLEGQDVAFEYRTEVTEIRMDESNNTVQELSLRKGDEISVIGIRPEDMVFFTNGSMTQASAFGDNDTVAPLDRSGRNLGLFEVWRKLAAKDPKFGRPDKFLGDIEKMTFISYFVTIRDFPHFIKRLEDMTGSPAGTGGATSIKDSSWEMGFILHHNPFFPDQPVNVQVFWGNGLYPDRVGDHVKKPMFECTGAEIITEFCYHMGLLDMKDELLRHAYVSVAAMPYITSQFAPRKISDRPLVVPRGCTNLAFIGQYVEVKDDAVFTVETSVRTAMEAVFALTKLDKDPLVVAPDQYDIRQWVRKIKEDAKVQGDLTAHDLPSLKLRELFSLKKNLLKLINRIPAPEPLYQGRDKSILEKESVLHPSSPLDRV